MLPDDPRHGQYAGYYRHLKDGETPCDACQKANNDYHRQYYNSTPQREAASQRRANARRRAYVRLSRLHPDEFKQLYEEEKKRQ